MLAAHGYTVLLPDHPGSDFNQQKAMLAGDVPPPGPEELRLRPLDVSALLDATSAARLLPGATLNTAAVAVVGHSWEPPPRSSWPVVFLLIPDSKPVATISRIRSETSVGCSSAVGCRG